VKQMLGRWVQALFWATGAIAAVVAASAYAALVGFNEFWSSTGWSRQRASESWSEWDDAASTAWGLWTLPGVVLLVLLIIWMFRAHRVTNVLGGTDREWSQGWTIACWFIPVANLLIPKLVLGEIERMARSPHTDGRVSPDWRKTRASVAGWLWWWLWLGGVCLVRFSGYLDPDFSFDDSYSGSIRTAYLVRILGALAVAAGAAFGAMYIRSIASHLPSPTAMPRSAPVQSQDVGSHAYTANIAGALRELKALHDEGILTDAEYETKRQELADQL
jgi:hypothetical protein